MKKLKLSISGMHCSSCASNVERSIKSLKGIKSVSVSAITGKCFVECEDATNKEDLEKAVAKTGYKVVKVE
ncbi:MAG: heavy metal-associated domain-containing protein [Nanoarchaeota archaeon]